MERVEHDAGVRVCDHTTDDVPHIEHKVRTDGSGQHTHHWRCLKCRGEVVSTEPRMVRWWRLVARTNQTPPEGDPTMERIEWAVEYSHDDGETWVGRFTTGAQVGGDRTYPGGTWHWPERD